MRQKTGAGESSYPSERGALQPATVKEGAEASSEGGHNEDSDRLQTNLDETCTPRLSLEWDGRTADEKLRTRQDPRIPYTQTNTRNPPHSEPSN
jgi:hypothetical protein